MEMEPLICGHLGQEQVDLKTGLNDHYPNEVKYTAYIN